MSIAQILKQFWSRFLASAAYEDDPGFHDTILHLCRRGMVAFGVFGVVGALAYLGAHAATGTRIALSYGGPAPAVVLWDKLAVFVISAGYLALARTRSGPRWGRLAGAVCVLAVSLAWMLDDALRGDMAFSERYLSIVLLVAVATIPYKPWQALRFVTVIWGVYLLGNWYLPVFLGSGERSLAANQFVYMILVAFLCTGISAVLYESRYRGYRARRRTEELLGQVAEQAEQLQAMERLKARFFANISHEFRTPLTLILGPVEDALDGASGPVGGVLRQRLQMVRRSGLRLHRLINQLLDLSKLEAGRMALRARQHNLVSFLRTLVLSFTSLAERKRIDLQFQADADRLALYFDADKLEKVMANLLSNAFKFTPEHGAIRVSVRGEDDDVAISVRDTGPGISAEEQAHIFDRFYQVEEALAHAAGGTGIGLALAKEMVELHGGAIRVESEPGFGSEFVVHLPRGAAHLAPEDLADAAPEEPDQPAALVAEAWLMPDEDGAASFPEEEAVEPPEDAPVVLVVDDNADLRAYLKSHLAAHYRVAEAEDGEQGVACIQDTLPDLVVSDVMMPKMDGYELCHRLKEDERLNHIPVILLTAKASEGAKVKGLAAGADDYLYKPFSATELLARVENLIELRRQLRHRFSREVLVGPSEIAVPSAEAVFLEQVREVVEQRMGNSNFGVDWLADEVGLSVRQLRRRLKAATRLSPGGYIKKLRLERAGQLLAQQAGTVAEIAYAVGFRDPDYFSRLFKQTVGVPPSEYRTAGT